jgi:outer membrane protein assembly factor BamB
MQNAKKTMAIAIAIVMLTSMACTFVTIPTASAANWNTATQDAVTAGMNWPDTGQSASTTRLLMWTRFRDQIPTWVFLTAAPNPVGVGQAFNLVMFNPQVPYDALLTNDIRYTFTMDIKKPNGDTEHLPPVGASSGNVAQGGVLDGKFVSDSTGSAYTAYTPDQTGNYTFTVNFQQLTYHWNASATQRNYYGTTFKASNYTLQVTVQQDSTSINGQPLLEPLPTEYWSRPIEGQNTAWYLASSNWLSGPHDRDNGGGENRYQAEGTAPESPHILWTRPTEDNGVVGGENFSRAGNVFNAGSQYQPRWNNPIIMYGRLYYTPNVIYSGTSELYDCVDLKTGQLIWEMNTTALTGGSNIPSFGYYYSDDNPNEHGIANPGWLFTNGFTIGYQPERGIPYLHTTGVPSGFDTMGPAGETIKYVFSGSVANGYALGEWNSSLAIATRSVSSNLVNCTVNPLNYYDWNVTLGKIFSTSPTIRAVHEGEYVWGSNGTWNTGTSAPDYAYVDEVTVWAISIKNDATLGKVLYMKNIDTDDATLNTNNLFERASGSEQRFVTIEVPNCVFHIYDMTNGNEVGKTEAQADWNSYGYFTWPSLISQTQTKLAYGILYTGGYTGAVSAYSLTDGSLLWRQTYPSGGEKIQNFVQMIGMIADGKIYVGTHEHSADTPLYKGEQVHCLNATDGTPIWSLSGWAYPMTFATADGVLVYWNNYDAQVYAIGKGPTQMTLTAPDAGVALGSSVTIKGTVNDISAGTKQEEQAARFPNGVAAVSEDSMKAWMEYVYEQKGRPTNTTGVPVSLIVLDSNNNYQEIGTAVSDSDGFFSLNYKPQIEGKYTVYATFAGSAGYWSSHAVTAFSVDPAPVTAAPPATAAPPMIDSYFLPAVAGIIAAIVIVGAVLALLVRKRP